MVTAAILAGGQATRFGGRDKSALIVEGRSILERQIAELRQDLERQIAELRQDVERQIAELRQDVTRQMAELRQEMSRIQDRTTIRMGGLFVVGIGALAALMKLT